MNELRFLGKADDYDKFRPSYPIQVIDIIKRECNLNEASIVADIGAGTGIFTQLIAGFCNQVYAIEPNSEMLAKILPKNNVKLVLASAENTTLANNSVDIVTIAQAFHWFDKALVKRELSRILKSNGFVVIIYNNRNTNTAFEHGYEQICQQFKDDYLIKNDKRKQDEEKKSFFKGEYSKFQVKSVQTLDFDSALGRLLSLSYMPKRNEPSFKQVESQLRTLFDAHASNELVNLSMETEIFIGKVSIE